VLPSGARPNSRRREGFGANLTIEGDAIIHAPSGLSRLPSLSPPPDDPVLAEYVAFSRWII
jgi:hypothetical protein